MHGLERFLVDLVGGQHVRYLLDQGGYVRSACSLVFLVLPKGDGRGLPTGAVHPPVPVVEAWLCCYVWGVSLLEDGDALIHLLWPNLYRYDSR